MSALALYLAPTAAWVCALSGAAAGLAFNAGWVVAGAVRARRHPAWARAGAAAFGLALLPLAWAAVGVLLSPLVALAAAALSRPL